MSEVVLFHHALGRSPGIVAFADQLRRTGHMVHTPDLFHGEGDIDAAPLLMERVLRFLAMR